MSNQPTEEELQNMSPEEVAKLQKKNCVFCKIIVGEIPSNKVYEDDKIVALLDIYPAVKGHTLVIPKEHIPIMPLLPPETFKHIFKNIKYLEKGVKKGTPSATATVFIANGAAAGQQSPHFLFHIIPRDEGDELMKIPKKEVSQSKYLDTFKTNITGMMQNHLAREGKMLVKPPSKGDLATILEDNQQLMEMIIKRPEEVKKAMESNAKLKSIFQEVDIDKLSSKLKEAREMSEGQRKDVKQDELESKEITREEPKETTSKDVEDDRKESEEDIEPPEPPPKAEDANLDEISNLFK